MYFVIYVVASNLICISGYAVVRARGARVCMYMCVYVRAFLNVYVCVSVCTYICMCECVLVYVCI